MLSKSRRLHEFLFAVPATEAFLVAVRPLVEVEGRFGFEDFSAFLFKTTESFTSEVCKRVDSEIFTRRKRLAAFSAFEVCLVFLVNLREVIARDFLCGE
jgi:hypothetical protein